MPPRLPVRCRALRSGRCPGALSPLAAGRIDDCQMTVRVIRHERLGGDCARAFVALVDEGRGYHWLGTQVRTLLGVDYELALSDARGRVRWQDRTVARQTEAGLWRARI